MWAVAGGPWTLATRLWPIACPNVQGLTATARSPMPLDSAPDDEDDRPLRGLARRRGGAVGVFVSFASLLVYTFGVFLKPLARGVLVVPRGGVGRLRHRGDDGGGVRRRSSAHCSIASSPRRDHRAVRSSIFGCAFASLSLLTPHLWHLYAIFIVLGVGRQRHGADGLCARRLDLVRRDAAAWRSRCCCRGGADRRDGAAAGGAGAHRAARLARRVPDARRDGAGRRPADGAAVRSRASVGARRPVDARAAGSTVREGLRSRVFWILVVVLFFSSIAQNGAITHLSALLTDRGVSAGGAAHRGVGDGRRQPCSAGW